MLPELRNTEPWSKLPYQQGQKAWKSSQVIANQKKSESHVGEQEEEEKEEKEEQLEPGKKEKEE